jgi:hypothetical protein
MEDNEKEQSPQLYHLLPKIATIRSKVVFVDLLLKMRMTMVQLSWYGCSAAYA